MRTAKAVARLRGCAGSPEPSLFAYVISTIISCAGSNNVLNEAIEILCFYKGLLSHDFHQIILHPNIYLIKIIQLVNNSAPEYVNDKTDKASH